MRPIWFFVGIVLIAMGSLVILADILTFFNPFYVKPVLAELHAGIWWGGIMIIFGIIFLIYNKGITLD